MRVAKHKETITCPWCNAGATMTFQDDHGKFCMACKRHLQTGEQMAGVGGKVHGDARTIE